MLTYTKTNGKSWRYNLKVTGGFYCSGPLTFKLGCIRPMKSDEFDPLMFAMWISNLMIFTLLWSYAFAVSLFAFTNIFPHCMWSSECFPRLPLDWIVYTKWNLNPNICFYFFHETITPIQFTRTHNSGLFKAGLFAIFVNFLVSSQIKNGVL